MEEPTECGSLFHQTNNGVSSSLEASRDSHPKPPTPTNHATSKPASSSISYWEFLSSNRNYRWFILSYLITHFGEWLTYIASIDFIESVRASHQQSTSRTALSILILVRLLPNVVLSALGGTLADSLDRRLIMIFLDICGALCACLFILAYQWESIFWLYVASCVQQCIAGLYAPSHSAIVTQLVQSDVQLKKATTLEGLTWSAMQAFGAAASGWMVGALGIRTCFIVDGISYGVSALFLAFVTGSYKVAEDKKDGEPRPEQKDEGLSLLQQFITMVVEAKQYLSGSYFGALIFLKATAALGYGACDILNVAFAEQSANGQIADDISSNHRLGILFSLVGIGCMVGPLVAERHIHVERPITLQISCVVGFGFSTIGYFGWASIPYFWSVCIFSVIRAAGSSNIWIHSTLLLQKMAAPNMLGRVLAADYAMALVGEALAAYFCGVFMDIYTDWTPYQVSLLLALLTLVITLGWSTYHLSGRGAAMYEPATEKSTRKNQSESSLSDEHSPLLSNKL